LSAMLHTMKTKVESNQAKASPPSPVVYPINASTQKPADR